MNMLSMNMLLSVVAFAAFALGAPYPTSTPSSCTPGNLVCNGTTHFGICTNVNNTVWQPVAAGTICVCSSAGNCIIANSEANSTGTNSTLSTSQSAAPNTMSTPPVVIQPVPSTTQSSAPAASTPATSTPAYSTLKSTQSSVASPSSSASASTGSAYKQFNGDGSVQDGWPSMDQWLSFDALWTGYAPTLGQNCDTAFGVPNNSPTDSKNLRQALLNVSNTNNVPPQFALAIAMQESLGCVFVDTTNNGVTNPGLFQSHDGSGTCDGESTCPDSEIVQMCTDGIAGTTAGPGLAGCEKNATGTGAQRWYEAARIYNSGSVPSSGDLGAPGATPCYSSDVANRLMGWTTGESQCTLEN